MNHVHLLNAGKSILQTVNMFFFYMASSVSGQDESNPAL